MQHNYIRNVATLELDQEKCTGCGMCTIVCPHAVLAISDKKAQIIQRDACMECGACSTNCPFAAISVQAGVGCAAAILRGKMVDGKLVCDCDCC
ncbi:MAG: mercury methylation ferredoxin HgcB [Syntrophomonadaceae bacterium]